MCVGKYAERPQEMEVADTTVYGALLINIPPPLFASQSIGSLFTIFGRLELRSNKRAKIIFMEQVDNCSDVATIEGPPHHARSFSPTLTKIKSSPFMLSIQKFSLDSNINLEKISEMRKCGIRLLKNFKGVYTCTGSTSWSRSAPWTFATFTSLQWAE